MSVRSSADDEEWARLVADRAAARRRWAAATGELKVRARDPLGIRGFMQEHPYLATGIGAGAAALLVKAFLGSKHRDADEAGAGAPGDGAPSWKSTLRSTVLKLAVPWITQAVASAFAGRPDGNGSERAGVAEEA